MEKLRVAILLCLLILTGIAQSQETDVTQQAAQAYVEGNYIRAITLYDQALLAQQNGALYYNLGASHYAAGNLAEALWSFRMAALYSPRDAEVQAAIVQIRARNADSGRSQTNTIYLLYDSLSRLATPYELGILGLILWTLGFLVLIVGRLRSAWRRATYGVAGGVAVLVVMVLFTWGVLSFVQAQRPGGVVLSETAQVMNGPGMDFLPLFTLSNAAELRVLERNEEWLRFVLPDGRQGWLQGNNVKLIPNDLG